MYNLKKKLTIVVIALIILLFNTVTIYAAGTNSIQNELEENTLRQESSATTLIDIKEEQLSSIEGYKAKYGSDTYGIAAYILHLVQIYSIPIGLVGIAICAIYEYVIGIKRL